MALFQSRRAPVMLLVYAGLALLFTATLLAQGQSAIIGANADGAYSLWVTWWPTHALAHGHDIVTTDSILFPLQSNLLSSLSLTSTLIYALLKPLFGPIFSFHLLLPLFLTANAYSLFRWLTGHNTHTAIAFVAGLLLAFNPLTHTLASRGEFHLLLLFPLIWTLSRWDKLTENPTARNSLWLVFCLYLTLVSSLQFANLIVTLWLPYALYTGWRASQRSELIDHALIGLLGLALLTAIYPISALMWSSYTPHYPPIDIAPALADYATSRFFLFLTLLIGTAVTVFLAGRARASAIFWLMIAIWNGVIVVGFLPPPFSIFTGIFNVPLPDLTATHLFLFPSLMALLIVFALHTYEAVQQIRPTARLGLIGIMGISGLLLSGWQFTTWKTSSLTTNAIYQQIAGDPDDYTIIDYPVGIAPLPHSMEASENLLFGQTEVAGITLANAPTHNKRVVGGFVSSPQSADVMQYASHPIIRIAAGQDPLEDTLNAGLMLRREFLRWDVRYILVHTDRADSLPITRWLVWTNIFCHVGDENSLEIWRRRVHSDDCPIYELDVGEPIDELAFGDGWDDAQHWEGESARATTNEQAILTLWATPDTDYEISFSLNVAGDTPRSITIITNEARQDTFTVTPRWATYTLSLPREHIREGGLMQFEFVTDTTLFVDKVRFNR